MEQDEKPFKTHIRVKKEYVKNKIKTYPRCYYVPLNDDSTKNLELEKTDNKKDNHIINDNNVLNTDNVTIKKEDKGPNSNIKKIKHELQEQKSKEEKKKKKEILSINSSISVKIENESKDNIKYKPDNTEKKVNDSEFFKNRFIPKSDETPNPSINNSKLDKVLENNKEKPTFNFESLDENNSDWSNYNSSSTLKSNTQEEYSIQRKRELSKSLESLFDDEIKNKEIKEKEKKKKLREKKLERMKKEVSNFSDDENNEDIIKYKHLSHSKSKISNQKNKFSMEGDIDINDEDNRNKSISHVKKEMDIDENTLKKSKVKKEIKIEKNDSMDEDKMNVDELKSNDGDREKKLSQIKKKIHKELMEKDSDKDQDSSFESKDKMRHAKSSSLQFDAAFIKAAKQVIKKKKRGEELNDSEIAIYNKILKKRKLEKAEINESRKLQKTKVKKDKRYISSYASKPCISAEEVITDFSIYEEFGNPEHKKIKKGQYETIKLLYPNGKYESFPLIVPKKPNEMNPIYDLYSTTQMIIRYVVPSKYQELFGDTKNGIIRSIIKAHNRKNKEGLKKAINEYNKTLEFIINDKAFVDSEEFGDVSAPELVSHILEQAYIRTVAQKSEMLNSYRGFSNNVYGEVNSNLVTEFIKNSELKPHHVFIDMGSGIGNVVLQVASQVLCESWGVEIMEIPSTFARAQCIEFISRMRYYGKPCGKIKLRHADFLEDPEVDRILKVADVVFVNNYAFDADLNQQILQKFLDLKENTRIISLKNFVPLDHKINKRNVNSLESILRVKEYYFGHDSVSWTNEEGKYYIHRVDRSILQSFEKNLKANRIH